MRKQTRSHLGCSFELLRAVSIRKIRSAVPVFSFTVLLVGEISLTKFFSATIYPIVKLDIGFTLGKINSLSRGGRALSFPQTAWKKDTACTSTNNCAQ